MAETDAKPTTVRRIEGPEATVLAGLASVFSDLQHVLRCCEHLVSALADPRGPDEALVESLWSAALTGYVRCFSTRAAVLTKADLDELQLDGDVGDFHPLFTRLRDHYASRHTNPRESFTIGIAQSNVGKPVGVAVIAAPNPQVDDPTVRLLGRVAYALSGLVDARMQKAQNDVLGVAQGMSIHQLALLPYVYLTED